MATYYWIGGSGDFNDPGLIHWSLTSGGSPSGLVPGASDNVVFDSSGGVGTCTFPSLVTVTSFTANNNSISFNTGGAADLRIRGDLSLAQANKAQIQSYFEGASFKLYLEATSTGTYTVSTNTLNITEIVVNPSSSSTNYYLTSFNTMGTPGYVSAKKLTLTSGNVYFGYNYTYSYRFGNVSTTSQHTAIDATSATSNSINTSSSNPDVTITAYGDVLFGNRQYPVNFAASTILEFRGSATPRQLTFNWSSGAVTLSKIANYTGEDISGASVGSGVQLQISGAATQVDLITCTAAGSVSGTYARGITFDSTYQTTFTNLYAVPLNAVGDATNQVILTAPSSGLGYAQIQADYGGSSNGILQVYFCTLSKLHASAAGQYLAYTGNGNIDGGGNQNWVFSPTATGAFFAFFN